MPKKPQILSVSSQQNSSRFKIEKVKLRFANGEEREFERTVSHVAGVVIVVPILDDHIILIREYGLGIDRYFMGFPKGAVDAGETSIAAAQRELMEEAGYGANQLTPLCQYATSPAYVAGFTEVFLAQDLFVKKLAGDEPEELEVIKWPLQQIDALLHEPDFLEARSIAALYYLQRHLRGS